MDAYSTEVLRGGEDGAWLLRVRTGDGVSLWYRYKSEQQAKFMAAVFELNPSRLPPASRIDLPAWEPRKQKRRAGGMADFTPAEIESVVDVLDALAG